MLREHLLYDVLLCFSFGTVLHRFWKLWHDLCRGKFHSGVTWPTSLMQFATTCHSPFRSDRKPHTLLLYYPSSIFMFSLHLDARPHIVKSDALPVFQVRMANWVTNVCEKSGGSLFTGRGILPLSEMLRLTFGWCMCCTASCGFV